MATPQPGGAGGRGPGGGTLTCTPTFTSPPPPWEPEAGCPMRLSAEASLLSVGGNVSRARNIPFLLHIR